MFVEVTFIVCIAVGVSLCLSFDVVFFKQKTAYEMRISDWSSDVCSSDLLLMVWGMWLALYQVPADYQQGNSFRILFIHVPAAWMSLFIYGEIGRASCRERVCPYV